MDGRIGSPADGLAFFGRIVAATSHELVNVLNIVGEVAGLQDDLLRGAAAGEPLDPGRLAQLAERIRLQTERGQDLLRHLNRFGHSVDQPFLSFDLADCLECHAVLARRFARLARVELTVRPPTAAAPVSGSPFALQMALVRCLEICFTAADRERRVTVAAEPTSDGARVIVTSADPLPPGPSLEVAVGDLERVLATCPGELEHAPDQEDPCRFSFVLRSAAPASVHPEEDDAP
jgi:C4-dicarboxylate-specific signal transduction histidine kinase